MWKLKILTAKFYEMVLQQTKTFLVLLNNSKYKNISILYKMNTR